MAKYYEKLGFMSPSELTISSLELINVDAGLAAMLSQLAVVRQFGTLELEEELSTLIQNFLRKNFPQLDDVMKQNKAEYN